MKKLATFASDWRANALLCCSAAVLLTACGGGQSDAGQQAQLAARTFDSVTMQSDATVTAGADAELATTPAVEGETAGADARNFELVGYESNPLVQPPADESSAPAEAAPADGATRLLATAAFVSTPATATNYYVSPSGSDTASGSKTAPFKTLARAAKAATKAGTTVWVAPGTYAGGFKTTASGTAASRIYYVSTTKWGAKLVPPAKSSNSTAWDNRGNYVSIIGFDIDGTKAGTGTKWLHGIYNGGSYDVIQGNRVHHIAKTAACTSGGGSAIGVDSYYKGIKGDIIGNTVHDIGPASCKYIQGIYMSTSGTIKNNVVYRVGEAAIHLWHDANNVIITNNTVTSSNFGIIVGGGDFYFTSAGATNVHVYNNIVYDNKYGISEQGKTGTTNTYRNNLVYQNPGYNISLKNGLKHTNTVSSNPLLISYSRTSATPNFKPTISSPAVGRGTATYAHPTDIDGRARTASTGFDIGAYQH
jgi:hypothetical protein